MRSGARTGRACAYFFETSIAQCVARNQQRQGRARVPKVAIFATAKQLKPPLAEEDFDAVHHVSASPSPGEQAPG